VGRLSGMISETDLEARRQEAAGMILESETATSSLEDDEAEVLPNWALAQVKSYALSSKDMGEEEAHEHMAKRVGKVRHVMRVVKELVEEKHDLSCMEMVKGLTYLPSLAMEGPAGKID
jgi:hypothetical protein